MLENFLKDLSELVNLDCGTHNTAGVTQAAKIMKRHFEELGWKAELVDLGEEVGKGLFATNKPDAEHYDLLMNAHLDTVFPDGTAAARPFKRDGNIVTGPGCQDCKAGVLSILYTLKNAAAADLDRLAIAVCLDPDGKRARSTRPNGCARLPCARARALSLKPPVPTARSCARERAQANFA